MKQKNQKRIHMKDVKRVVSGILAALIILSCAAMLLTLTGCEFLNSWGEDVTQELIGTAFDYREYDAYGNLILQGSGNKVMMAPVEIPEYSYDDEGHTIVTYTKSSVMHITIDGYEHITCGASIIFAEKGLYEIEFDIDRIGTHNSGIDTFTSFASWLNSIKNNIGTSKVVLIKSELGYPLAVYGGESVYWEVVPDLPKTTKLSIDGKVLYIHRVQYDIVDLALAQ